MNCKSFILICVVLTSCMSKKEGKSKPNVIYILADDLGYGDLGVYGQKHIKTPNIDRMASEGMLFTNHYSGSTVCAPSRCSLLTGLHTGHSFIRGNIELQPEGQQPLSAQTFTIAELMKEEGYVTGAFGKWGLGMANTDGDPNKQGFDEFFGYLCQRMAHRYYPEYLWHNGEQVALNGNDWSKKNTYAQDVIQEKVLDFIRAHKDEPFFLYVPHLIPHAEFIVPQDSFLSLYDTLFDETPWGSDNPKTVFGGNNYGSPNFSIEGYTTVEKPRATYAAMVSRLDSHVGQILELLKELNLDRNTLVIFTSDNGPHREGGADPEFFGSRGGFRGYKRDLYEGAIKVPHIAWWPGKISAGEVSNHVSAFWDLMPTLAELVGRAVPENIDGISFLPTLLGREGQMEHDFLYWEFHELGGRKAIKKGNWKLVLNNVLIPNKTTIELYNLSNDPSESINVAADFPEITKELTLLMDSARVHSEIFRFDTKIVLESLLKMN